MFLPLRIKFLLVAAGVAVAALGSALWVLGFQLERRLSSQIADLLLGAESTFLQWKNEHQNHLDAEARIVAHDPRFFAAVAEGDEATALPTAREFQALAGSDLFLVCDRRGRRLAHLDTHGPIFSCEWPYSIPPADQQLRWDGRLFLIKTQSVTVGLDTVGYVALGRWVNETLAKTMARVAGADVIFFDNQGIFGSTLKERRSIEFIRHLKSGELSSAETPTPHLINVGDERFVYRLGRLADGDDASYAVVMSLDQRLAPQTADLRGTVLWVGSLALVFAFAVSWSVARRVTARVPQLVAAVEAVARGNYEHTVHHAGHDELGAVAEAVDRMRHELAAQINAISRANEEKLASERLAVIGKMSSTIIHDFKTPIQVIRTAVELSSEPNVPPAKRERYASMIVRELDRMVGMAQDLLGFARGERRMARSDIDLREFFVEAIESWRQICLPKSISVESRVELKGVVASIDRDKIQRALDNIVVNATEVLSAGGLITVSASQEADDVVIHVTDNGPGIPGEIRDMIFEPFASFGKEKGSGLGLAMAKKAVEDHGGVIAVTSAPGAGTTFSISLPLGPARPGKLLSDRTTEGEALHASARV